ncbi:MAG: hypothetical protein ACRYGG_19700 [Janthinobacterium lividum]
MMWTPLDAIKAKWKQIRPHEDVRQLDRIAESNAHLVLLSVAFEAGRQWQFEHLGASVEFPDYDAKPTAVA